MRRPYLSFSLLLGLVLVGPVQARSPAELARERLTHTGTTVDATHLVQYAAQGDLSTVSLLLQAGIPAAEPEPLRRVTALHAAAAQGQLQIVELLLAHQAAVDAQDERGLTALVNAAHGGHIEVIDRLLKAGAHVDIRPAEGPTALLAAVQAGRLQTVRVLLAAGADPSQADSFGATPLQAARRARRDVIHQLLEFAR